jgi:hypothetical protein
MGEPAEISVATKLWAGELDNQRLSPERDRNAVFS